MSDMSFDITGVLPRGRARGEVMTAKDWNGQVADALAHLEKPDRKLAPAEYCEIIDDVVIGKLTAAEIAEKHGTQRLGDDGAGSCDHCRSRRRSGLPSNGRWLVRIQRS